MQDVCGKNQIDIPWGDVRRILDPGRGVAEAVRPEAVLGEAHVFGANVRDDDGVELGSQFVTVRPIPCACVMDGTELASFFRM